jgi:Na+/H+ antiporter NhaD/arsenite permease-like protein
LKAYKTPLVISGVLGAAACVFAAFGFTSQQIIATVIFLSIICGTLSYWKFRLAFALAGLAVLLGTGLIDIPHMIEFAGLDIILFLFGMMAIIGFLEENHFFEYLVAKVVDRVGEKPYLLMFILMLLSTFFAALVDEVTSILFMMATMFHITKRFKVNPAPFLMMIVFATNIGSSATAVGNPIGVMIALRAGFTFADFLRWAAPISLAALAVTIPLSFLVFRGSIRELGANMKKDKDHQMHELENVKYTKKGITLCWALFVCTIASLVMHHSIEHALGLTKNTLLIGTALVFSAIALFLKGDEARDFFVRRVDWWTLSFFMILFASVGTLKYVGVTEQIAKGMIHVSSAGGNVMLLNIFTGAICLLTAFMDNVLAVATFIPILTDIEKTGVFGFPFWWAMLFGGTIYGNATIIGSTANIVAMGLMEKETGKNIKFMEWFGPGLVVSTAAILLAMALLYAQFHLMPGAPAQF